MKNLTAIIRDDEGNIQTVLDAPADVDKSQISISIGVAYLEAVKANPEEWNFGDVAAILESWGYNRVEFVDWKE